MRIGDDELLDTATTSVGTERGASALQFQQYGDASIMALTCRLEMAEGGVIRL